MLYFHFYLALFLLLNLSWALSSRPLQRMLVVGDGDLSFSASIAENLAEKGISLVTSVLEDQKTHHQVYKESQTHLKYISSWSCHAIRFSIDATNLAAYFPKEKFNIVQFNFPHWRGKANNKQNRELLSNFFKSAVHVLSKDGQIRVALCQGQGGSPSRTTEEFRQSWKAAQYAAEHGLMLRNVVTPYVIQYDLSSHRGVDRTFPVGEKPELYIFDFPNGDLVHTKYQMCCRHELHILLDDKFFKKEQDIVCGDAIPRIIQGVVPEGIRVEVPLRRVLSPSESDEENTVVVFLVVYCGERIPLCRGFADECRAKVEQAVDNHMKLRENRAGRIVSRLFPYPTWQPEELLWFSKHQESVTHWCKITSINESK